MRTRSALAMLTALVLAAPAGAAVKIEGPTQARFLGVIGGGDPNGPSPFYGDGSHWVAYRDMHLVQWIVLDDRTLTKRRAPRACKSVGATRAVFMLTCTRGAQVRLFFARSGRVRDVPLAKGEYSIGEVGRHWLVVYHPYPSSGSGCERCTVNVAYYMNWRTGERVIVQSGKYGIRRLRDLDDPDLGPSDDSSEPTQSYCGEGQIGGWVTTPVTGCLDDVPPAPYELYAWRANSLSLTSLEWTITGGLRPKDLPAGFWVFAFRTRNTVLVAVLQSLDHYPDEQGLFAHTYTLWAIPLPRA